MNIISEAEKEMEKNLQANILGKIMLLNRAYLNHMVVTLIYPVANLVMRKRGERKRHAN